MNNETCVQSETDKSADISSSLREILFELRGQKSEINSLKDKVNGQALAVAEVKKLKTSHDISWRFTGNRLQYEFNSGLEDVVNQTMWAVENGKLDYAKELITDITEKLRERNKHIRIADTSEGGWETVRQYKANPLASDSDDESRLLRADSRAIRKKKQNKSKPRLRAPAVALGYSDSMAASRGGGVNHVTAFRTQLPNGDGHSFRGYQGVAGNRVMQIGPCFACGEFNHVRRNCPHTRGVQQQSEQPNNK